MRVTSYRHSNGHRGRKTLLVPLLKLFAILAVIMYVLTFVAMTYWRWAGHPHRKLEFVRQTVVDRETRRKDFPQGSRRREDLRLSKEATSNLVKAGNGTNNNTSQGFNVVKVLADGLNKLNSLVASSPQAKPPRKYIPRLPISQGSYSLTNPPERIHTYRARIESISQAVMNKFGGQIQFKSHVLDLPQVIGCFFFRSAVHVRKGVFVLSRVLIPHCNLLEKMDAVAHACSADISTVKCNCTPNDIRVICIMEPATGWDLDEVKYIYLNDQQVQVPVEHIVPRSLDRRESVHVCLQGIVYPDMLKSGLTYVPLGLLNAFLNHYSRYADVTDFHIYTNGSELVDGIVSDAFRPEGVLKHARIWFHDSLFPPRSDEAKDFNGREKKAQLFVQSDCYLRAIAMNAKYVLMIDQDEFLYPSSMIDKGTNERIGMVSNLQPIPPPTLAVFFKSHMFHTVYCEGDDITREAEDVESNLKRMTLSRLDKGTFQGRRKGLFIVPDNVTFAINNVFPLVHGLELAAYSRRVESSDFHISERFHLHHFREPYHESVCSKNPQKDPIPEVPITELKWTLEHAKCEDLFTVRAMNE